MLALTACFFRWTPSIRPLALTCHFQSLNKPGITGNPKKSKTTDKPPPTLQPNQNSKKQTSIYEELFPEEAAKQRLLASALPSSSTTNPSRIPRLAPLKLPPADTISTTRTPQARPPPYKDLTITDIAILVLHLPSTSLTEADFRRAAPKGQHIKDWTGPGDILKVFPGRDVVTLAQQPHYILVFKNPANASAYRSHVQRLHSASQTHTPRSIESPLPMQPLRTGRRRRTAEDADAEAEAEGVEDEENAEDPVSERNRLVDMLKDYTLCPPSLDIQIKYMSSPFAPRVRALLRTGGYPRITRAGPNEQDVTGRAVLFWVEGSKAPATSAVENVIRADGRERDLPWECEVEELGLPQTTGDGDEEKEGKLEGRKLQKKGQRRWVVTFKEDEDARRFARRWHRRSFPMGRGWEEVNAYAEILW